MYKKTFIHRLRIIFQANGSVQWRMEAMWRGSPKLKEASWHLRRGHVKWAITNKLNSQHYLYFSREASQISTSGTHSSLKQIWKISPAASTCLIILPIALNWALCLVPKYPVLELCLVLPNVALKVKHGRKPFALGWKWLGDELWDIRRWIPGVIIWSDSKSISIFVRSSLH